jgi:hypothetical protein
VLLVPLVSAPTVVALAGAAERRFGSSAAGWTSAIPTTLPVAILGVAAELGDRAGATLALSAAAHVGAQVAFAVVFALMLGRFGVLVSLAAGAATFAALSVVLHPVPAPLAAALAVPALLLAPRLLPGHSGPGKRRSRRDTALASAVALTFVSVVLLTAQRAGPAAAGAIGAFPALSTSLALVIARETGAPAAAAMLQGMIRGLPGYLAFCLTVTVLAPACGTPVAVAAAACACLAVGAITWRSLT